MHSAGWPLDNATYGGGFLYHMAGNQVSVGLVVGLGYANPYLEPYQEFQRYKTHPLLSGFLDGGKRIAYGARAINASGLQSLPKLVFPGGALVGCDAGFLNAPRIKGSHAAIKTGMLAGDAAFDALAAGRAHDELAAYPDAFASSWLHDELHRARNFKPLLDRGLVTGAVLWGVDQLLFRGKAPWTLHRKAPDHAKLRPAAECVPIEYPKPDGVLTFDKLSSVYLSNTNHEENQPAHLTLKDASVPVAVNLARYAGPEARYLPGGRLRVRDRRRRQAAAADQLPELRPLQDLRHQGSDAEHRLGRARRRRRPELREHVAFRGTGFPDRKRVGPAAAGARYNCALPDPPHPETDHASLQLQRRPRRAARIRAAPGRRRDARLARQRACR